MILDITQNKFSPDVKISYIDKSNDRQILSIKKKDFWYWKYARGKTNADTVFRSWDDKPVIKLSYKDSDIIDKKSIWEFINTHSEYRHTLYEFNMPKILFCDIETDILDGFPNPNIAKEKITAITLAWKDTNNKIQLYILGEKENFDYEKQKSMNFFISDYFKNCTDIPIIMKYLYIPDEVKLLETFIKFCSKFHILTGWNFINTSTSTYNNEHGFDWHFLSNRMKNLKIDFSAMSPTNSTTNHKGIGVCPDHFCIVDYMYYFDKFDRSIKVKESMSLDFISGEVLKVKKLKYGNYPTMDGDVLMEMYNNDYDKYCTYCAIDTILVLLIHEKRQPLSAILAQGNDSGNIITKADSAVNVTEGLLLKRYLTKGKVLPQIDTSDRNKEWYEGAFVKDPIAGFHRYTCCYDFSSLYPSISRLLEVGFENFTDKLIGDLKHYSEYKKESVKLQRPKDNKIISVTGCVFEKGVSVLKEEYDDLYKKRKLNQYRSKLCAKISHELKQKLNK